LWAAPYASEFQPERSNIICRTYLGDLDLMTRIYSTAAAAALLLAAVSATHATAAAVDPGRAGVVKAISDCRKLTDSEARLACYDKAADAFDQAQTKGDIVVVDRAQVRQVTRQSFGFNLPSFTIFQKGSNEPAPENIAVHVAAAEQEPDGKWLLTTDEDTTWKQIDTTPLTNPPTAINWSSAAPCSAASSAR
jgi:hypothetical protein